MLSQSEPPFGDDEKMHILSNKYQGSSMETNTLISKNLFNEIMYILSFDKLDSFWTNPKVVVEFSSR